MREGRSLRQKWSKDTPWGHVTVTQQRSPDGLCVVRSIEIRNDVGLQPPGRPTHLWAMDVGCDEKFDMYRTRDPYLSRLLLREGTAVLSRFDDLLVFLMYSVLPVEEIPDQL